MAELQNNNLVTVQLLQKDYNCQMILINKCYSMWKINTGFCN